MKLFQRQRSKLPTRVATPVDYPTDVAVHTEDGVYLIKGGMKYECYSARTAGSWRFTTVPGSIASISEFKHAGLLGFRAGSLIKNIADGKIYLICGVERRHIQSPDVFSRYGFDRNDVIEVSQKEVALHKEGKILS